MEVIPRNAPEEWMPFEVISIIWIDEVSLIVLVAFVGGKLDRTSGNKLRGVVV